MDRANMEPMTAANATLLRCDATISTEKPASFVVTFKQEVWTGEEGEEGKEEGEVGVEEELGEEEGDVESGGEEDTAKPAQTAMRPKDVTVAFT